MTDSKKPLPLSEVRRLISDPKTKIVMAPEDVVEALRPYVDRVLAVVKDVIGFKGTVWLTDESCLNDIFCSVRDRSQDQRLYDQIGEKLGIALDCTNDDDLFFVRVALKLKRHEVPSS